MRRKEWRLLARLVPSQSFVGAATLLYTCLTYSKCATAFQPPLGRFHQRSVTPLLPKTVRFLSSQVYSKSTSLMLTSTDMSQVTLDTTSRLNQILCDSPTREITPGALELLRHFLSSNDGPPLDDCGTLAETSVQVSSYLITIPASTKGHLARKTLEQKSEQLLSGNGETQDAVTLLAYVSVVVALSLNHEEDRAHRRAAGSAMASILQRCKAVSCSKNVEDAQSLLRTLLMYSVSNAGEVDWHIIAATARAMDMKISHHPQAARAVAHIVRRDLCLDDNHKEPEKLPTTAVLGLAAQLQPWSVLQPVLVIEPAVLLDLWDAAEKVCTSATEFGKTSSSTSAAAEAVEAVAALVEMAMEAKAYRRADNFATEFYESGGQSYFLEARFLHACDTIAKLIQKRKLPLVDRQVERIDLAVTRVVKDKVVASSMASEEIRVFAIRRLEEAGEIDGAYRLAKMWGIDYLYDEEAAKAAAIARREKYLQWEEALPGDPPDLVATPDALLHAFDSLGKDTLLFGFDAEWTSDNSGVDVLQVASLKNVLLLDVPALSQTQAGVDALAKTVGAMFASDRAVVVGFGCSQDSTRLRATPCIGEEHWFRNTTAVVDLQALVGKDAPKHSRIGLARVSELYLGKALDKAEQCSLWSTRPLSVQQRVYAALDAWVCATVYEKILNSRS